MELSPEEAALFGDPTPAAVIPPDAPANSASVPPPAKAAKKLEVMPGCADCGTDLTPDNASKKRGGGWKHTGCQGLLDIAPMSATPTPAPAVITTTGDADAAIVEKIAAKIIAEVVPVQITDYIPAIDSRHSPATDAEIGAQVRKLLAMLSGR